jgi:hypothetical protein
VKATEWLRAEAAAAVAATEQKSCMDAMAAQKHLTFPHHILSTLPSGVTKPLHVATFFFLLDLAVWLGSKLACRLIIIMAG